MDMIYTTANPTPKRGYVHAIHDVLLLTDAVCCDVCARVCGTHKSTADGRIILTIFHNRAEGCRCTTGAFKFRTISSSRPGGH